MTPERVRQWAEIIARRANHADWPMPREVFEPFVLSIVAEAQRWRDAPVDEPGSGRSDDIDPGPSQGDD